MSRDSLEGSGPKTWSLSGHIGNLIPLKPARTSALRIVSVSMSFEVLIHGVASVVERMARACRAKVRNKVLYLLIVLCRLSEYFYIEEA